jgi:hypothetical protein
MGIRKLLMITSKGYLHREHSLEHRKQNYSTLFLYRGGRRKKCIGFIAGKQKEGDRHTPSPQGNIVWIIFIKCPLGNIITNIIPDII